MNDPRPTPVRVAVVGGGMSGLALAHHLLGRADVTVHEASAAAGGHVRTVRQDGFVVEAGPNGFLDRFGGAIALVHELGLEGELLEARPAARRRYLTREARLHRVPDSPPALLASRAISLRAKTRLLLEPWAEGAPAGREETVHEFACRRIGPEAADTLVDTAVAGISAGDSRRLSLPAAFPAMAAMEREHGSLLRALVRRRRAGIAAPRLLSLRQGMGQLVEALAGRLGPRLFLSSPVRAIEPAPDGGWDVVSADGTRTRADRVVLAVPARVAARLTGGLASSLRTSLEETPFSSVAVVALGLSAADVPHPLDGYGYLVPRAEGRPALGVTWESSLFEGRAPEGAVLLRVLLGGARDPSVVELRESERVAVAREEIRRVLGVTAAPRAAWSFAWPAAIAQYVLGHRERVARARATTAGLDGLSLCGTSYDGISLGAAIEAGRAHADALVVAAGPRR